MLSSKLGKSILAGVLRFDLTMHHERKEKKRISPAAKCSIALGSPLEEGFMLPMKTMKAARTRGKRMPNKANPLRDIHPSG